MDRINLIAAMFLLGGLLVSCLSWEPHLFVMALLIIGVLYAAAGWLDKT